MFARLFEDCVTATDAELDTRLRDIELRQRALDVERAAVLATISTRGAYRADGHRTIAAYLRATINTSNGSIARHRKLARLVEMFPEVGDGLLAGHISTDHALELARVQANPRIGHLLAIVLGTFLDAAEHSSHRAFHREVEFIALVDQAGAFADLADNIEGRTATVTDVDGALMVRASGGDPIETAQMVAVFESFLDGEYRKDLETRKHLYGDGADQHELPRTPWQRRYDAFKAIFAAAAGSPDASNLPDPECGIVIDADTAHEAFTAAGITLPNGNQIRLDDDGNPTNPDGDDDGDDGEGDIVGYVTTLADELVRDPDAFGRRRCQTSTGAKIHPIIALRAMLTGHIRRIIMDSKGVVIDYGTKQRLFTGLARKAALILADGCDFLGCETPARWSQVDHNIEAHQGGETNQANGRPKCGPHNLTKHKLGLTVKLDQNGRPYHVKPDGTIMLPVGERPPDLDDEPTILFARVKLSDLLRAG